MENKKKYYRINIYLDSDTFNKLQELRQMGIKFNRSEFFVKRFLREFRKLKRVK